MWQDFREVSGCPLLFKQTLSDLSVLVVAQLYQNDAVLQKNRESRWTLQTEAPKRMNLRVGRLWIFHLYVTTCFPVGSHLSPFFSFFLYLLCYHLLSTYPFFLFCITSTFRTHTWSRVISCTVTAYNNMFCWSLFNGIWRRALSSEHPTITQSSCCLKV